MSKLVLNRRLDKMLHLTVIINKGQWKSVMLRKYICNTLTAHDIVLYMHRTPHLTLKLLLIYKVGAAWRVRMSGWYDSTIPPVYRISYPSSWVALLCGPEFEPLHYRVGWSKRPSYLQNYLWKWIKCEVRWKHAKFKISDDFINIWPCRQPRLF